MSGRGRVPRRRSATTVVQRVVDVVVAAGVLVATLPILVVVVLAIRLDSTGPVIMRQHRMDETGRPFEMYRLRSTVHDAEEITRVGRVVRWASVDELPVMWNVLRGEMSLVGPPPRRVEQMGSSHDVALDERDGVSGLTGTWTEPD